MKIYKYPEEKDWAELQKRPEMDVSVLFGTVRSVFDDVRANGDKAVIKYEEKFDGVHLETLQTTEEEFSEAEEQLSEELKAAVVAAKKNIEAFHSAQRFSEIKVETMPGVTCWQRAVAIEKVGLYIPGGTAPLFSTVLMLAVPARIAGCKETVICTPPYGKNGKIHPAVLYAAQVSGINKVYKAGGIQAIAAMACGTETIPKTYKIFGPGNQYVMAAKQFVGIGEVAIDMPAGPSEIAIIADANANPKFIAADFLSQAEHGADSQSVLLTTSETLADDVEKEIAIQTEKLLRRELTEKSLSHSRIIVMNSEDEIIRFTNDYAPEHLIVQTENYRELSKKIVNAGSVFLGAFTPESAGDYASGTNHTLPTKGYAKMYSGVNLDSFIKKITYQEITRNGLDAIGHTIEVMAANEHLDAHRNAVAVRLENK